MHAFTLVFYNKIMCILVSCSFDDVTSGISICFGIAVTDSVSYRVPIWYRSNLK